MTVYYDPPAPSFKQVILHFTEKAALTPMSEIRRAFLEVLGQYFGQETISLPMVDFKDRELSDESGKGVSTLHLAPWAPDVDYRELPTIVVKVEKTHLEPSGFGAFREGDSEGLYSRGGFLYANVTLYLAAITDDDLGNLSDGVSQLLYSRIFWGALSAYSVAPQSFGFAWTPTVNAKLAGVKSVYASSVALSVYQEFGLEDIAAPYAGIISGEEIIDIEKAPMGMG